MRLPHTHIGHLRTRIVGRALLNDTYGLEPGVGGVVYDRGRRSSSGARASTSARQQIAVKVADGSNRAEVLSAPAAASRIVQPTDPEHGFAQPRPHPAAAVDTGRDAGAARHRRRVAGAPRVDPAPAPRARSPARNRVYRRRRRGSLRWQVAALSLIAAALTIPPGALAARLGWQLITPANGLAMGPVIPRGYRSRDRRARVRGPRCAHRDPRWFEVRRNAATILRTE